MLYERVETSAFTVLLKKLLGNRVVIDEVRGNTDTKRLILDYNVKYNIKGRVLFRDKVEAI